MPKKSKIQKKLIKTAARGVREGTQEMVSTMNRNIKAANKKPTMAYKRTLTKKTPMAYKRTLTKKK